VKWSVDFSPIHAIIVWQDVYRSLLFGVDKLKSVLPWSSGRSATKNWLIVWQVREEWMYTKQPVERMLPMVIAV